MSTDIRTELDLDAIEARANAADPGPWTAHDDGLVWTEDGLDPISGSIHLPNAQFIAAARTGVPALVAEVRRFKPATQGRYQIFIHTCGHTESWHETTHGAINEQGCDACESSPDGGWQPVYVRDATPA